LFIIITSDVHYIRKHLVSKLLIKFGGAIALPAAATRQTLALNL